MMNIVFKKTFSNFADPVKDWNMSICLYDFLTPVWLSNSRGTGVWFWFWRTFRAVGVIFALCEITSIWSVCSVNLQPQVMSTLTHGHDNDTKMTCGLAAESECQCWKRVQSCQETLSNIGTGLLWQVRERMVSIVFVPEPFLISFQFHLLFAGLLWTFCSATFGRCRLDRASYACLLDRNIRPPNTAKKSKSYPRKNNNITLKKFVKK